MDTTVWSSLKSPPIASLLSCVSGRSLENPHSGNLYSYKPHRRKHKAKVSQHWIWQRFLSYDTKSTGNWRKTDKMDFRKILKFCASKITIYSQSEKATHRMREDSCESYYLIRNYYLKYIAKTPKTQQQKTKQPDSKHGQRSQMEISPKKIHKWPFAYEKMLNVTHP